MSRRRSRNRRSNVSAPQRRGRDVVTYHSPIAKRRLPRTSLSNLRFYEDRRTSWPDLYRPAFSLPRSSSRLVIGEGIHVGRPNTNVPRKDPVRSSLRGSIPNRIGFEVPKDVVICIRRKRRREVMHAFGIAGGRGVGRGRRRRTNEFSEIGC